MKSIRIFINQLFTVITALFILSCGHSTKKELNPRISAIDSMVKVYKTHFAKLPNEMQKNEFRKSFIDTVSNFFIKRDHVIGNIKVTVQQITTIELGGVNAFVAKFTDHSGNEYYTEFDYALSDDTSLKSNPAYLLVKDMPEKTDTTLNFLSLGKIEWSNNYDNYLDNLRFRVIPFKQGNNLDSLRLVAKEK